MNHQTLIHRYLLGEATDAEVAELDRLLAADPSVRRDLIMESQTDAGLREIALERLSEKTSDRAPSTTRVWFARVPIGWLAIAASVMLVAVAGWSYSTRVPIIAKIVSAEDAAWESSLPTEPGSDLTSGYLKLTSGIATLQFRSGAEITLEAPANLVLKSSMRARLNFGAALIEVPDSAIGFVLETPGGYAVDYGTQFAVHVDDTNRSEFEVLSGEIAVHTDQTGQNVRLADRGTASIANQKLTTSSDPMAERTIEQPTSDEQMPRLIRIGTNGRSTSVIRNNKREKRLHPDLLMLRTSRSGNAFDRRCFFSFDVSDVDVDSLSGAELKMNLVPSGLGFANRLPKVNRFAVYGLINPAKDDWKTECLWEDAPTPEDGTLLGKFEIPRSRQTGVCGVGGKALLEFIRDNADRPITLILVRETSHINGTGASLVHAIASDSHPKAPGPVLELTIPER